MIKKIIILGAGRQSADIIDIMDDINRYTRSKIYECIGLLDDDKDKQGKTFYGRKVLGPLGSAEKFKASFFINGICSSLNFHKREEIIRKTGIPVGKFLTVIHPKASVSKTARIGLGAVIFPNVTVSSNAKVGNHVVLLSNSVINHDVIIGDYTCIASGVCISGGVKIGKSCYFGTGSLLINDIAVGNFCLIGMGSVVLRDVGENNVVVGIPARFLRKLR